MFRKSSSDSTPPPPRVERTERSDRREQSFLQSGVKVDGDITAEGDLRVEGQVVGTMKMSGLLTIGSKAEVEGVFNAHEIIVHGQLKGTIHSESRIHLAKGARVQADLYCSALMIEDGVFFQGSSNMGGGQKPGLERQESPQSQTRPASSSCPQLARREELQPGVRGGVAAGSPVSGAPSSTSLPGLGGVGKPSSGDAIGAGQAARTGTAGTPGSRPSA